MELQVKFITKFSTCQLIFGSPQTLNKLECLYHLLKLYCLFAVIVMSKYNWHAVRNVCLSDCFHNIQFTNYPFFLDMDNLASTTKDSLQSFTRFPTQFEHCW